MKKLISFIILLALCISLFSCAKAPELDSATPDVLTEDKVQDAEVVIPEPQPEQTPEQPEQPEKTPGDAPVTDESPVTDEAPAETEEMAFTKDDQFSSFEVAVLLTEEETKKNKTYSVADFEGYDIFSVVEYNCYPEHIGKKGLVLYLNEPSKERVLEYCEKLSKDPRIALAEPNIYEKHLDKLYITIKEEYIDEINKGRFEWFPELDLEEIILFPNRDTGSWVPDLESEVIAVLPESKVKEVYLSFESDSEKTLCLALKKLVGNKYISSARPVYFETDDRCIKVVISDEGLDKGEFSADDFPELKLKKVVTYIEYPELKILTLFLEKPTKMVYKLSELLSDNPLVKTANVIYFMGRIFEKVTN